MSSTPTAFIEIGYGNPTFINTEIEYPNGTETRQPGTAPLQRLTSVYFRLWVGKTVFILSSNHGFSTKTKPRSTFKALLGFSGPLKI